MRGLCISLYFDFVINYLDLFPHNLITIREVFVFNFSLKWFLPILLYYSKLGSVITKKILKWLQDESSRDPAGYAAFFEQFGQFLKEGVCTDAINKNDLAKLLRFNSSASTDASASVSLADYIARMPENQTNIYYLQAAGRDAGMASPYYEAFKEKGIEVLFLSHPADHIVMTHLDMFKKHKIVSCESSDPGADEGKNQESEEMEKLMKKELTGDQGTHLTDYLQRTLQHRVQSVKVSTRLTSSVAIITDHEQASMQKFMKTHGIENGAPQEAVKYHLQVNPKHEVIRKLFTLSSANDEKSIALAKLVAEQVCVPSGRSSHKGKFLFTPASFLFVFLFRQFANPQERF